MACPSNIVKADLPDAFKGCTCDGLTWALTSVDDDVTEYAAVLSLAVFQLQDSDGAAALTLSSAVSGEVTLNATGANAWSITVEPFIVSVATGVYSLALVATDDSARKTCVLQGTLRVHAPPIL